MAMTKTLSLRVKDQHAKFLLSQSKEVNFVWNFVNDLSYTICPILIPKKQANSLRLTI